ncbi:AAA family ATPase [Botrimarina mediterranea]|uniref:ATP-dependent zinc metalloprotease FtsH n=1 Tax=Botrimarina mediterranea TaxID=2528022 RepID=A0A518K7J0_9BACT|nr:ATP-binding protein [Botrimarina mediterranea]QDV73737.1 ATP-dependent zinc metalloprotease FtsH [Botrimarina mediterranea]
MKAEMIKRIVRAIADGSQEDLSRLAQRVVETERERGHERLAGELSQILAGGKSAKPSRPTTQDPGSHLRELPLSRRSGELLLSVLPRESLEHHMVLPPAVEERFARVEREYAARERLGAYGLRNRKRILLYGRPGCGKSLGAQRLAWNTGLPLLKVRFDALISSFFGESATNLRAVFDAARERPCVLLLDECDFIARSRTSGRDIGEASRIVNSLLQLMEEYDAPGLLVATTNIDTELDNALFRRFDEILEVPPPGPAEIEQLLKMTLSAVEVSPSVKWRPLVGKLAGSSAAIVVKVARDAAKAAVLEGKKVVTQTLLEGAIADRRCEGEDAAGA